MYADQKCYGGKPGLHQPIKPDYRESDPNDKPWYERGGGPDRPRSLTMINDILEFEHSMVYACVWEFVYCMIV